MSDAEYVKKMLRSVLQSSKAGVAIHRLQAEYRSLCGEMIPLWRLGYKELEPYLRSVPSAVRLENRMGELTCFAAVCQDTVNIAELVARQRSTKKTSKTNRSQTVNCRMRPSPARLYMPNVTPKSFLRQPSTYGFPSWSPSRPSSSRPYNMSRSGVSATGDFRQLNQRLNATVPVQHRGPVVPPRSAPPAQVNRGPVVSLPFAPPANIKWCHVTVPVTVPVTILCPVSPSAQPVQLNRAPVLSPLLSVIRTEKNSYREEQPGEQVQSRLTQLLAKHYSGLWKSKLPDVYKKMFNEQLHPQTLIDMHMWTHICQIEHLVNRADCLVYPPLPPKPLSVSTTTCSPTPKPRTSPPAAILTPPPTPKPTISPKSPLASPTFIFPPKPVDDSPVKPVPPATCIRPSVVTSPSISLCPSPHLTVSPLSPGDITLTPVTSPPSVHVSPDVRVKLKELLSKYAQGLWAHALSKLYLDTYKTAFPEQVHSNLSMLPDICTVEYPFPNNKNKAILYSSIIADLDMSKTHKSHVGSSPVIPSGLRVQSPVVPPPLEMPKEQFASALVTDAKDCTAVTVRYVGDNFSKALEAMEDTMRTFYSQSSAQKPLSSPAMGQLAAVQGEDGDELARAQIVAVLPFDKIMVYYVDYGFSEETKRSNLLELNEDFLTLPFQATNVRLAGLESFSSHQAVLASLDTLAVGKILLMEFVDRCDPLVVLYDTSQDDDVNINQLCLKAVQDRTMDNPLTVNSTYQDVSVTNVCSDGTLHCQLPSRGTVKLHELLDKIQAFFLSQVTSESLVTRSYYGKLCLSRYKDKWSRAEITNIHGNRVMDIVFIDLGIPASVSVTELREIPTPFLNDLTVIPPQAIKCCLADLTGPVGNPETVLWLREAILYTTNCSMKIVQLDQVKEDRLVHIYLYPNSSGGQRDKSFNHQLAQSELWLRLTEQNNNIVEVGSPNQRLDSSDDDSTVVERLSRPALRPISSSHRDQLEVVSPAKTPTAVEEPLSLPPPLEAPRAGQNLDVYVSVALHPGYFVVQPWQELYKLSVLMGEMALYYNRTEDTSTDTLIHKGHVYAGKVDKTWHRVMVKGVLTNGLVSIYELDYGKHELVSSTQLKPLIEEFRQLPFQAITAQLAGVGQQQWSEEASNLFRNHVEKKALVAQVERVQEGPEVWARRLTVYLVDTSQENSDVWIHKIMADIAEKLPTSD